MALARSLRRLWRHNKSLVIGAVILAVVILGAILAPYLGTVDPTAIAPAKRLKPPSSINWFGTDALGRDIYSRVLFGARLSLIIGFSVAGASILIGMVLGLLSGFVRAADNIIMRVIDGIMSIPSILLAIALMAVAGPTVVNVIAAITFAEIPRTTRLVRSVVVALRDQPFIDAARVSGAKLPRILWRHILPNTVAPLTVQATYIAAAAMIIEAVLSFVGAGTPPNVPSWGSMMADGRAVFKLAYHTVIFPGLFLSLTILAVNLIGDGLREELDPRLKSRR